jgi:hypothetical protein
MINFITEEEDKKDFEAIIHRALRILEPKSDKDRINLQVDLEMDIQVAHSNGNPLDFKKLLSFDDVNFLHDIDGIRRNLNRETGELEDCFLPRCSLKP